MDCESLDYFLIPNWKAIARNCLVLTRSPNPNDISVVTDA